MKVKILQPITTGKGKLQVGDVVDVKPRVAETWIKLG